MMRTIQSAFLVLAGLAIFAAQALAQDQAPAAPQQSLCTQCHGDTEFWDEANRRFYVPESAFVSDVHWQKGLRCHDCHGGDPTSEDYASAHARDAGFRKITGPVDIPGFCGHCHSNIGYMRHFRPSPRTDQEAEYWTSGHGIKLKADRDPNVATCVSCHGNHGVRAVEDLKSPVYPTNVAETCARCHADEKLMAGRTYNGKPIRTNQHLDWQASVHGQAMLERGDVSAPTCNDCHGNHGALPPEIGSVANACGTCHGKVASLFEATRMRHQFEEVGLPGCATCHGDHAISSPNDDMLGMAEGAVCARCHQEGKFGAPLAGAEGARAMRQAIETLKHRISSAERKLGHAERLGMEVRGSRYDLHAARDALTNARSLIHGFALHPVAAAVDEGVKVTIEVERHADDALEEHRSRRIWLVLSVIPITLVIFLLLMYAKHLPPPGDAAG